MPLPALKRNTLYSTSFFIFLARFLPSLASLLVMIWYSRSLQGAVYGQWLYFWVQVQVLTPLVCFGIHVVLITYPAQVVRTLVRNLHLRHFVLFGLWAAGVSAVFAVLQQSTLGISPIVPFAFLVVYSVTFIVEALLIVSGKFATLVLSNMAYAAVFCFIHWRFVADGFPLQTLFCYWLALAATRLAVYVFYARGMLAREHSNAVAFDREKTRSLWLHLGLYDVLQVLFSYIDKFAIALVLPAAVSAIYYNGSQNIPFLPLLLSAAASAVLQQLAATTGNERSASIHLMNQTGKALACVVFPAFCFLFFFRSEVILELFQEPYRAAIPVFAMSVLVLPVRAYNFTLVLQRHHKGNLINIGAVADLLLACALMYPLYLWLGLPGVALSFVITTYLQAGFYLFHSARLLDTNMLRLLPLANWAIKLIVFACLFIAIHYVCNLYFSRRITVFLGCAAVLASIVVSLYFELNNRRQHGNTELPATVEGHR